MLWRSFLHAVFGRIVKVVSLRWRERRCLCQKLWCLCQRLLPLLGNRNQRWPSKCRSLSYATFGAEENCGKTESSVLFEVNLLGEPDL
jgi:hypothetical protein